jgi:hypothetical protein
MPRRSRHLEFCPPPSLTALMSRQRGTFTSAQARASGVTAEEIQDLRCAGVLASLRRGVYVVAGPFEALDEVERHLTRAVGVRHVLGDVVFSHETAALANGMDLLLPDLTLVHVTRPHLQSSRREAGIDHHCGALPDDHVAAGDLGELGTVTSLARTVFDIASMTTFERGLAVVDSALRMGATQHELLDVLEFARSWSGSRVASRAIAAGDGRAANPGESFSRAVLMAYGLDPTDLQIDIYDEQGFVGRVDFGWLPLKVVGEFDGRSKYGLDGADPAERLWAEKRREDRLRALGYEVVRWTWADLLHPERFIARLRAALARAEARVGQVG